MTTLTRQWLGSGRTTTVPSMMVMDDRYGPERFIERQFGGPAPVYGVGRECGQTVLPNLVRDSTWAVEDYTTKVARETNFPSWVSFNATDESAMPRDQFAGSMVASWGNSDLFSMSSGSRSLAYGVDEPAAVVEESETEELKEDGDAVSPEKTGMTLHQKVAIGLVASTVLFAAWYFLSKSPVGKKLKDKILPETKRGADADEDYGPSV